MLATAKRLFGSNGAATPTRTPTHTSADVIPFPRARIIGRPQEKGAQTNYDSLARKLRFAPEELVRTQILGLLKDRNIPIFDYDEVDRYMTAKRQEARKEHWFWRPLRDKDELEERSWNYNWDASDPYIDGYYRQENGECQPYERLVPLHALQKVALIEARFRNKISFFVSDYGDPKPDPFLGVMSRRLGDFNVKQQMLVIDVWDEPGFGKKK